MSHFHQRTKKEDKINPKEKPYNFIRTSIVIFTKAIHTHSQE